VSLPRRVDRPITTEAFDRIAGEYDDVAAGEIFCLLRRRTHAAFTRRFAPGARVLEIGCGTGLDTAFLAARGVRVVACDPSEEMVSRALRRLAHEQLDERAVVVPCGLQDFASFLDALAEPEGFDGIISNFGALNCVEHLAPLRALAHRYLRPGGALLLGVMGRACAIEAVYFVATRRASLASRRRGCGAVGVPVAGLDVPTFYHRIADIRAALGEEVALVRIEGVGVAIPPPYMERRWQTLPAALRRVVSGIDRVIAAWPPFNRIGDHVLLHFAKRPAHV
jgi:SAM-dependent methyltransferase